MRRAVSLAIVAIAAVAVLIFAFCNRAAAPSPSPTAVPTATAVASPTVAATATSAPTRTPTPAQTAVPSPDRAALVALYNATDGPNWNGNANWLSNAPVGEWYGVTTDGAGRVVGLYLSDNRLSGDIPAELGSLSNLEALSLAGNELPELGNLSAVHDPIRQPVGRRDTAGAWQPFRPGQPGPLRQPVERRDTAGAWRTRKPGGAMAIRQPAERRDTGGPGSSLQPAKCYGSSAG